MESDVARDAPSACRRPACTQTVHRPAMHWRNARPRARPLKTHPARQAHIGRAGEVPPMLRFQQERDESGGGVALRSTAEEALLQRMHTPGLRRQEAKALVLRSFDRMLSDDARCSAYKDAISHAVLVGVSTACIIGSGSLLPALLLARAGVAVCLVEPHAPLAEIARACARDNHLSLAVVPEVQLAAHAWGGPPDLLVSEAIDDGLFCELLVPKLREARRAFHAVRSERPGRDQPIMLMPCRAMLTGLLVQLGFEGVDGFGLDGLDLDLRHFDALRPSGRLAAASPGYWPVRLSKWRQPHLRLSVPFALGDIDLEAATAPSAPAGAGGVGAAPSSQTIVVTRDGLLNAVVYYFRLEFAGGASVSSAPPENDERPGSWRPGWRQAAIYLEKPFYVHAGETLKLTWQIESVGLRVYVECMSPGSVGSVVPKGGSSQGVLRQPVAPPSLPRRLLSTAMLPCNAYHFCMLADKARNEAYRRAIDRAVRRFYRSVHHEHDLGSGLSANGIEGSASACRVLDLGAGSGLLGVIATRAGATRIDAVEMNCVMAETATRTLESSGVKDFRVHKCVSTKLRVAASSGTTKELSISGTPSPDTSEILSSRVDIVVSETLDSSLIGEGAIHSLRHAAAELLRQDGLGCIIPAAATVFAMAVEFLPPDGYDVDYCALQTLREGYTPLRLHTMNHICLSAPAMALHVKFGLSVAIPSASKDGEVPVCIHVSRGGKCNAIVWWFDLHLDDMETLSVAPGSLVRTWKQNVHYLRQPILVDRGDELNMVFLNHQDDNLHVCRVARHQGRGAP